MQNLTVLVLSNLFFQHVEEVFIEELLLAHEVLPEDELFDLVNKIENGLAKASETFKKWILGSSNDSEFAHAIFHVLFSASYNVEINLHEKNYIELLERDKLKGINQSFGLLETLQEQDFLDEFQSFSAPVASDLHKFTLL
ncbi:12970_t:CDS:2, partial [Entrophospora sp. SA101]